MGKKIKVTHISSVDNTLRHMPRYNAYGGGYGPHRNKKKYPSRNNEKVSLKKDWPL